MKNFLLAFFKFLFGSRVRSSEGDLSVFANGKVEPRYWYVARRVRLGGRSFRYRVYFPVTP